MQLHAPALKVKFGKCLKRVKLRVKKRGHQHDLLRAKSRCLRAKAQHPYGERCGKGIKLFPAPDARGSGGFGPFDQTIIAAETGSFAKIRGAHLVKTHQAIDAFFRQFANIQIGAKAAVSKEQIAGVEKFVKHACEHGLVLMQVACRRAQKRSALQAEKSHEFEQGKPASRLLILGLRPHCLIGGRVGHGNRGAIDDPDAAAFPESALRSVAMHLVGQMGSYLFQSLIFESGPCLTVGARNQAGRLLSWKAQFEPCGDPAHGVTAGGTSFEHLSEKGPEGYHGAEETIAAIYSGSGFSHEILRNEPAKSTGDRAQATLPVILAGERGNLRAACSSEEQRAEGIEERRRQAHVSRIYTLYMPIENFFMDNTQKNLLTARQIAALRKRFEACKEAISALDWLSEGSVTESRPGSWRWTRKVKAKTVTVTLRPGQVEAFQAAIANHRRLEQLIKEMRSLSQKYLLESTEGPIRRTPKNRPKPSLS